MVDHGKSVGEHSETVFGVIPHVLLVAVHNSLVIHVALLEWDTVLLRVVLHLVPTLLRQGVDYV